MADKPLPPGSLGVGFFREDLDLSHIVAQYEKRAIPGGTREDARETRSYVASTEDHTRYPQAIRTGPLTASTARVLASARPTHAWDPNRYYRSLGVPWPYVNATKADLRIAYLDAEGPNDRWLTNCMRQLLNFRPEYDALPLGVRYLNDPYVQDELKRQAADIANQRSAQGAYTTAREVLDEQGYEFHPDEEFPQEAIDEDHLKRQDEPTVGDRWLYGFYVWGTYDWNLELLGTWQSGLLREIAGQVPYLAVGLMGRKEHRDYAVADVDGTTVVFIRHDLEVTPEITADAVQALLNTSSIRDRGSSALTDETPEKREEKIMTQVVPEFRRGGQAASEAAKSQGGGNFPRVHYFNLPKDGDTAVLRYVTDEPAWLWVDQHASVPTKNPPKDNEGTWPKSMPAVCRYDKAFNGAYKDCYIDDAELKNEWGRLCKASVRVWALACLREEVIGTQEMFEAGQIPENKIGKRVGFRDQTREIEETDEKGQPTGKKIQELAMVVVNMAPGNYFDGLQAIYSMSEDKTICDRDFVVKRSGLGKDSEYYHVGYDKTPNLTPETDKWEKYLKAVKDQNLDLPAIMAEKASDEYFARFFDPTKTAPARGKKDGSGHTGTDERPEVPDSSSNDVDEDKLAEMRARVRNSSTAGSAKPSPAMADVD